MIDSISVVILESSNTTDSAIENLSEFKYTIPSTLENGLETTLAIALLPFPKIFSPIIAFVLTSELAPNCIWSTTGAEESNDSYTDIIFTTSG